MNVNFDEMIGFFNGLYAEDVAADEAKKGIREDLKSYAEEHNVSAKAMNSAYRLYKNYASGKLRTEDIEECSELSNAVESYFNN